MNWVALPLDILERLERLGLSRDDRLLYVEGMLYAGQYLTDGVVTVRLPRLSDHPDADAAAGRLIDADVWESGEDGYVITDYFSANLSREEIDRRKEDARVRQERSRRHKAGDHSKCIRGRYCPEGVLDPVTRDTTRDNTRESRRTLPTSPDLPDLTGKVREGEVEGDADDGHGSPDGSPVAASTPQASLHIYADPQRLGHCCHCNLPAKNAVHHPGVPESLKLLAEHMADEGAMKPKRITDGHGNSWWRGEVTRPGVSWECETAEVSETAPDAGPVDSFDIDVEVPDSDEVFERVEQICDPVNAALGKASPALSMEVEGDKDTVHILVSRKEYRPGASDVDLLPYLRTIRKSVDDIRALAVTS